MLKTDLQSRIGCRGKEGTGREDRIGTEEEEEEEGTLRGEEDCLKLNS